MKNPKTQWAISAHFDLLFLLLSVISAPLFYLVFINMEKTVFGMSSDVFIFIVFTGLFDAPHIFQTFLRTHFDPIEKKRHFKLIHLSLLVCLALALTFYYFDHGEIFILLLGLYGGWHILRQHLGFLSLYQKKSPSKITGRIERSCFYGVWIYFLSSEMNAQRDLGEMSQAFFGTSIIPYVAPLTQAVCISLFLLLFLRYFLERNSLKYQWPKALFVIGQCGLFYILVQLKVPYLVMVALATLPHTLQYHGWMARFQKTNLKSPRSIWFYYGCWVVGLLLVFDPMGILPFPTNIKKQSFLSLALAYNGLVFWHYFIDGRIWKFRSQPELIGLVD